MDISRFFSSVRLPLLTVTLGLFLAACGGSSVSTPVAEVEQPAANTGTFGLVFTDKPTEVFSEIRLNITEATLIGGDDGQQVLFQGSEPVDLLDLTNFSEPIMFGEVEAGTYTKLRLIINDLELVPTDPAAQSIFPDLPANGKIDLLDQDGFAVLPGRGLLAEVDMDANKSIKVTGAGNSGKYKFRPVVKVKFTDVGMQDKLARVEGLVTEIPTDPTGSFVLCDVETPESCLDVVTNDNTSLFDSAGLPTDFTGLSVDDTVVVIGRYEVDTDIVLHALVVEIGGTAAQVKGNVVSNPVNDTFLLLDEDNNDLVVELQVGTKYFDADGEIDTNEVANAIVIGADVEVEGVKPGKADPNDPDLMRAALVFVEDEDDEQRSGTIFDEPATDTRTFMLMPTEGNNISVHVMPEAVILFVDVGESTVTIGDFSDLAMDQLIEIFGTTDVESVFHATEIIVEGPPPSP